MRGAARTSALVGLATPGVSPAGASGRAVLQAVGFLSAALVLGRPVATATLTLTRWNRSPNTLLVLVFGYLLLLAYAAHAVGLGMILGAYAAGLAFARHPERDWIEEQLAPLVNLLTPLFFVFVGASIDFGGLDPFTTVGREALLSGLLLLLVAASGKMLAAWFTGAPNLNRWVLGNGMMPRGEVGFVFAPVGLTSGISGGPQFASRSLALIRTTIAGPVLLKVPWRKT